MVKALVVEDEEDIRNLLVEQLLDKDCEVRKADNGNVALQRVSEEIPDIIFVDIVMPVMDEILFVAELRKNPETSAIPVVLVSAIDLPGLQSRAKTLGVHHLLSKPWDQETLDRMLQINNEWEIPIG
jgi:twitching motility two-component system response regulator PilG